MVMDTRIRELAEGVAFRLKETRTNVSNLLALVTDGRLSEDGLDERFAGKADISIQDIVTAGRLSESGIATAISDATKIMDGSKIGLIGDGTGNNAPAFMAAILALPEGYTLKIPYGTYRVTSTIVFNVTKDMHLDFSEATLVNASSGYALSGVGSFEPETTVSSIAATTIAVPTDGSAWTSNPIPGLNVNMASTMPWIRGDTVKIISEDPLEGQRDQNTPQENPNNVARYGQFMSVRNVAGTTATLVGTLREISKYTTGIRIARMTAKRLILDAPTITLPEEQFAGDANSGVSGMRLLDCYMPIINNLVVRGSHNECLALSSCYWATVNSPRLLVARDRPSNVAGGNSATYGYGLIDVGSEGTTVNDLKARQVRHAYTDDSSRGAAGRGIGRYGRTFGAQVNGGLVVGSSSVAYDCHAHGDSATFSNIVAVNCYGAVNFRGIRHTAQNVTVRDCQRGISVVDEGTAWGWSWGHNYDGVHMYNVGLAIQSTVHGGGPYNGIKETRENVFRNIYAYGLQGHSIYTSCTVNQMSNIYLSVIGDSTPVFGLVHATTASEVNFSNLTIDTSDATSVTHPAFNAQSGGFIRGSGYRVKFTTTGNRPAALVRSAGGTAAVRITNGVLSGRLANESTLQTNYVSYTVQQPVLGSDIQGDRPGHVATTTVSTLSQEMIAMICDVDAPTLVLRVTSSAAQTMARLPNGTVIGQRILILNTGTGALTIANGATAGNTALRGSTDQTVGTNAEIELVWSGVSWTQTYAV